MHGRVLTTMFVARDGGRGMPVAPVAGPPTPEAAEWALLRARLQASPGDAATQARLLCFRARGALDPEKADRLFARARRLDPSCAEARIHYLLAEPADRGALADDLLRVAADEARRLGIRGLDDGGAGPLRDPDATPYLHARGLAVGVLRGCGRVEEAVAHARALLRLDPADPNRIRWSLIGDLLHLDRPAEARVLLGRDPLGGAVEAWAEVLARLLSGDAPGAERRLPAARAYGPLVERALLGHRPPEGLCPFPFDPACREEAIALATWIALGGAFRHHPEACRWLEARGR
jgi:hypothetical protein